MFVCTCLWERHSNWERETETERDRERQRERHTDRERKNERQRQRHRERERERERENVCFHNHNNDRWKMQFYLLYDLHLDYSMHAHTATKHYETHNTFQPCGAKQQLRSNVDRVEISLLHALIWPLVETRNPILSNVCMHAHMWKKKGTTLNHLASERRRERWGKEWPRHTTEVMTETHRK